MKPLVVDASVGIKWYVPEGHSAKACQVKVGRFDLNVPSLFYVEADIFL